MEGVSYQNKDIASKVFAERFKGKALQVYGIDLPEVEQVLPTNLPIIAANELRMDNAFLLKDGKIAIVDYESQYKRKNKHKYIDYINNVAAYYEKVWERNIEIRMIVIYTADVVRSDHRDHYSVGCLKLDIESAYLSEIDREDIRNRLQGKIQAKEAFSDEEMMEFILLPLAYKGMEAQNDVISRNMDMISGMENEETKVFLLSGMAVFSDKIISKENADRVRRMINMTKVGQLFADEMERRLREREEQVTQRVTQQVTKDVTQKVRTGEREVVLRNLQSLHPEWSKTRTQREADVLLAR